ncbi:MAG: TFIIB-type zinc ribbon-containing protein [Thermoplasmatota archaeon]
MRALLLLAAAGGRSSDFADDRDDPRRPKAQDKEDPERRRELEERLRKQDPAQDPAAAGRSARMQVDKYFGSKLPPVCARLGCYITDDGKRFYCVNSTCQKHKKRATKHNRRGKRPVRGAQDVFFRCPRCGRRDVDVHPASGDYVCRRCRYVWQP